MAVARAQEGGVRLCGGLAHSRGTIRNHGARALQELAPGAGRPQDCVRAGLPLPIAREGAVGVSRPRIPAEAQGYLRPWVFLAPARQLRPWPLAVSVLTESNDTGRSSELECSGDMSCRDMLGSRRLGTGTEGRDYAYQEDQTEDAF